MSLSKCIRKAGKAINNSDATSIRELYKEFTQGGLSPEDAATRAVSEYITELEQDAQEILDYAESVGGDVSKYRGNTTRLATTDRNMETAAALSVAKIIDAGKKMVGLPKKVTTRSFAQFLTKRAKKLNRGKNLADTTPRNKAIISEVLAQETEAAMKRSGHAGNWYSETLGNAMAIAATIHPELNTNAEARTAFTVGMAVTSNGMSVAENSKYAEEVYAYYKKHGQFKNWGVGAETGAMKKAFKMYNDMKAKWGAARLAEFLHTEFTVAQLDMLGFDVSGENKDTTVYGSAIFGPKIGQAFFQNLSGNYSPLTMDRWWMRTWGRIAGNLAPEGISAAGAQMSKLRAVLPENEAKVISMGYTVEQLEFNDKKLVEFAGKIHAEYRLGKFKDKSELNKKSKNLDNRVYEPIVAPRNGGERAWIREVAGEALTKLRDRGMDINTASMQALLWYPEKEFYLTNGVGNERSKPTDFAIEFEKLARERGVPQSRIDAARSGDVDGRPAAGVGHDAEAAVKRQRGPALAKQARNQLVHRAAARRLAELAKGAYVGAVPKGVDRAIEGAVVAKAHKPSTQMKTVMGHAGLAAPVVLELSPNQTGAQVFHDSIKAAKNSSKAGGAVWVHTPEAYEDMRLFLTPDGMSGFALNGDELISVFKHAKSEQRGVAQALTRLAIEQGARRLSTYDTANPHLYSMQGFKAVSRVPFDDVPGWNKAFYKDFQNGRPDEVFMVYDRHNDVPYATGDGQWYATGAEGRTAQIEAADALEARNYPSSSIMLRLPDEGHPLTNQQPDNPLSQLTKFAATMEDQKNTRGGASWIKRAMIRSGDLLQGKNASHYEASLAVIPRRNIPDFVSQAAMPAAREYIRTANRMDGRRNELLQAHETLGKRWSAFVSSNKAMARVLGELMHAATLAGVDPSEGFKSKFKDPSKMTKEQKGAEAKRRGDHRILKKWWDTLDIEAQQIYKDVRETYATQRNQVEAGLMARIAASDADSSIKGALAAKLRKQFESGRVAGVYFPLARFGDLWGSAKDKDGNVVAFSRFEKLSDQKEWMESMADQGFTLDSGKKQDDIAVVSQIDPGFAAKVTALTKKVDPALADEIWQMYLKSMPEMSMRKGFMHRKGRLGFTVDAVRSFGHATFHGAHQLAKLEYMHVMEKQLRNMKDQSRKMEQTNDPDALWGNAVFREMTKRHEWAKNPKTSTFATKLTALGFTWYLGATAAAAAVNMSQTAIVGLPVLGAKFGMTKSAIELTKAAALFASSYGPTKNRLRGDERKAMEEAERIGLFDKTQSHDLAGVSEEGMDYNSLQHKTMQVVSWMFHKVEQMNREVTFLAGYRMSKEKGMSHNDAIMVAEDLTWDSHFDYNSVNRPRVMQGDTARILLLFRQYSMNMTYRLARDFNDSFRGADPALKSEARKRFSGIMGMTGLFAGTTGLPMFWVVEAVMNGIFGDEDEPYDFVDDTRAFVAQNTSPEVADIIFKGPMDYLTGATVSSRVSLNNLWIREAPAHLEGDKLWQHWLTEAAGPVLAMFGGVLKASQEDKPGRMVEAVAPKFIKDMTKANRYHQDGVQNRRGDVIIAKDEVTSKDKFIQAMGFTPAKITKQYEQNRAITTEQRKITKRKSSLMDALFLSIRMEDKRKTKEVMDKIVAFNRAQPTMKIDSKAIISSGRSRQNYSMNARGGIALNPNLRHLHSKKQF